MKKQDENASVPICKRCGADHDTKDCIATRLRSPSEVAQENADTARLVRLGDLQEGQMFEFTFPQCCSKYDNDLGGDITCPVTKGIVTKHLSDGMTRCGMDWPGYNGSVLYNYHDCCEVIPVPNAKQETTNV